MDVRTLLFANALVFAILAATMILVWRGNPRVEGLSRLARVHVAMMAGTVFIGLEPGALPAHLSMVVGNALVILGVAWLLEGLRERFALQRDRTTRIAFLLWISCLLFFLYIQSSLRARLLTTSLVALVLLLRATWTARLGLRKPEERAPSLLLLSSVGLLALLFAARSGAYSAITRQVVPISSDGLTIALATASLLAGTGWTFGVMMLVYARLNREAAEAFRSEADLRRIERIKDDFVAIVSHELRTPLTSIRGSIGLLAGGVAGEMPDAAQSLLDIAANNCERLSRLINDILDMEKIESGKMAFLPAAVELAPLVEQAVLSNRDYAHGFGVEIHVMEAVPGRVMADPDRLHQVVTNLLSNAVRYSPWNGIVEVRVRRGDGKLRVAVTDHGEGIPPEFQSQVFKKFASTLGTGLGLSISRAIVEHHDGRIWFETEVGAGTTFSFELADLDAADLVEAGPSQGPILYTPAGGPELPSGGEATYPSARFFRGQERLS